MPAYILGSEFTVNTRVGLDQGDPEIITLSDGRVLLTWTTADAGADTDSEAIAGRVGTVQPDGSVVWGAEFRVNTQIENGQFEAQVTELSGGRVLFTWLSNDPDVDGSTSGISARIGVVQADGSIVWDSAGEFTVNEEVASNQEAPQVMVLPDGRVMFAWMSLDADVDGSSAGISARIGTVQTDGSILWAAAGEVTVNEEVTNGQYDVEFAVLPDGRVLATWWSQDADVDGNSSGIAARVGTVQADGSISWGAAGEITVNEELQGVQDQSQVTILPDGRVLFVWSSSDPDVDGSLSGISARVGAVQADGSISWAAVGEITVNQETQGGQYHPQVIVLSDGRLLFVWTTYDTTIDSNAPGISARVGTLQADGSIVWSAEGEFQINAAGLDAQQLPHVTELDDGRVVITWQSADPAADGAGAAIVGRTLQFNQAPIAADDAFSVGENATLDGGSLFADNGAGADNAVDGDALAITAVNGAALAVGNQIVLSSGALLTVNADGTFAYNPNNQYEHLGVGETATDTFTYSIDDGFGGVDTATVTVTINGANDGPDAHDDAFSTGENGTLNGALLADNGSGADIDVDGDSLTVSAVDGSGLNVGSQITLASGALVTVNADGTFAYDANGAFEHLGVGESGVDSFTYTISDGQGGADSATVTFTINGANDGPTAQDDAAAVTEAGSIVGGNLLGDNGSGADSDIDGDGLTVSAVNGVGGVVGGQITLASGALLTVNADGTFDYDPNGAFEHLAVGESDTDTFNYTVSDGQGGADTATVTITINGINDDPDARNDGSAVGEDSSTSGSLFADNGAGADADIDGDTFTISAVDGLGVNVGSQFTLASGALLTVNADGTFSYDANGAFEALGVGENGLDTFTYTIDDGNGGTDTATVTITVNGANDAPVANDDALSVGEDATIAGGNLFADHGGGADSDVDGDNFSIVSINGSPANLGTQITLASGALLTVSPNGTFDYDPNGAFAYLGAGETAADSFTYTIDDGNGGSDTATVTLTINGANDAPVAQDDAAAVSENGVISAGNLFGDNGAGSDSDIESDIFTVTEVNGAQSNIGTQITLASGALLTVNADGTFDYDVNGAFEHLAVGETGADSFTYTIDDGAGGVDTATVSITINGSNDAPVAADDAIGVGENATLNGDVLANNGAGADADIDGDTLVVSEVNGSVANVGSQVVLASGALLTMNADGTFTYDPNGQYETLAVGETATDNFSYTINDGNGGVDTATVTLTINGANDAPVAQDDALSTGEDSPLSGALLADNGAGVDADVDGDALTITAVEGLSGNVGGQIVLASGALLTVNADGTFDYDANGVFESLGVGETDSDSFSYTISDGNGGSDTATVTITIDGVNDAPVAADDSLALSENVPVSGSLLVDNGAGADADIDGDALSVSAVNGAGGNVGTQITLASGALLTVNADGTYSYDPNGAFAHLHDSETANDSFTYTISDGNGGIHTATVSLTVNGVNATPNAANDLFAVNETATISGASLFADNGGGADSDIENDTLSIVAVNGAPVVGSQITLPSGALLIVNADGTFSYDPNGAFSPRYGQSVIDSFTYTVDDAFGGTDIATATISISNDGSFIGGSVSGETLNGSGGGDVISALAGADTVNAGGGGDEAFGGAGNDTINGGAGDDVLDGVLDADTLNGGDGNDTLFGRSGLDTLNGDAGEDLLYGGDGNDNLNGGDGNDLIDGLNHNDTAHGGAGDDVIYGRQNDDMLYGDAGLDTLFGGDGVDLLDGGADADFLDGGNGDDSIAGGAGNDTLYGRQNNDTLDGGADNDVLFGGDGDDNLSGSAGDDTLDGGNGVDRLDGGLGADMLIGGAGADTFVFSAALGAGNVDTIAVFNLADDRIELDLDIFTGIGAGALDADAFVIGAAALDAEDRIIYDPVTGALYYDADGDGAGAAVQFASLAPGLVGLTSGHFLGGP